MIYYFVAFGFNRWWFTAGIVAWIIGSAITKVTHLPIYQWVGQPENVDPDQLRKRLHTLALGNAWRAWLTLLSVVMACQFSIEGTATAIAACAIIAYPSLWLARKYMPNGSHH